MTTLALRRFLAIGLLALGFALSIELMGGPTAASADPHHHGGSDHGPTLDLETLTGAEEERMFQHGQVSAVQLVKAYLTRIAALNKAGPALNAVTQINPDVWAEAERPTGSARKERTSDRPWDCRSC